MELVHGTVIAGRYRLERPLAAGGMGAVWVARHLSLQTELAIKFMDPVSAVSPAARARFEREARSAAQLKHPNVVAVQDYGIEDDTPYLVMELLRGESLEDRLERERRLPLSALAPIFAQISRGLRKAHDAGVVHRDLKPGNVFLARDEDDGEEVAKLLDFGIAKEIDVSLSEHTKTSELMGSPHYMSPEQLRSSKKTDARSDLWSLGVVLYRALTGAIPFGGDTLAEVMVQVFSTPLPPPSSRAPGLTPAVDAFFQKALARNPDERFQSVREMSDAFLALCASEGSLPKSATRALMATTLPPDTHFAPPNLTPPAAAMSPAVPPPRASQPSAQNLPPFVTAPTVPFPQPPASRPAMSSSPAFNVPAPKATATPLPGAAAGYGPAPVPVSASAAAPVSASATVPFPASAPAPAPVPPPPVAAPLPARPAAPAFPVRIAVAAVLGVGVLLAIVLVLVVGKRGDPPPPSDAPELAQSAAPSATSASAVASGQAVTPDEMATAVPDDSPVVVEEPAPEPSASALRPSGWRFIPKGQARLKVTSQGGSCKVTINGLYQGTTPLDVLVEAGKQRIFCRMTTGSTRSKEIRAPAGKTTKIEFEVKQ
jgi:serine/threonine-protein kinase